MPATHDVVAVGNAIVDVIAPVAEDFLAAQSLVKGSMGLIDEARALSLYQALPPGLETSGGSAANTVACVASLGGSAAYIGKVAKDQLGEIFAHDMRAGGVSFDCEPLVGGAATARSMIAVTPDGQRTMSTFLGASGLLTPADVDTALVKTGTILYLEGYLFDPEGGRAAFAKAASAAKDAGRTIAITLSDGFVVDRHRAGLLAFIEDEVDLVFGNEDEVKSLFETTDFDAACTALGQRTKLAAITKGAAGSVILSQGTVQAVPASPVAEVIDTTGAGDQYAAGFMFGLARQRTLIDCARFGHLAAGEVIGHYGPRPAVSLKDLAKAAGL